MWSVQPILRRKRRLLPLWGQHLRYNTMRPSQAYDGGLNVGGRRTSVIQVRNLSCSRGGTLTKISSLPPYLVRETRTTSTQSTIVHTHWTSPQGDFIFLIVTCHSAAKLTHFCHQKCHLPTPPPLLAALLPTLSLHATRSLASANASLSPRRPKPNSPTSANPARWYSHVTLLSSNDSTPSTVR